MDAAFAVYILTEEGAAVYVLGRGSWVGQPGEADSTPCQPKAAA